MKENNYGAIFTTFSNPESVSAGGPLTSLGFGENPWIAFQAKELASSPTESWSDLPEVIAQIIRLRSSDIVRLSNEVNSLKNEVATSKKRAVSTQVKNIYSNRLLLKEPLNILLEEDGGNFVVNSLDLDIYGVGDSTQEATRDLGENIEDVYFTFKKEGKENLGPEMLKIWNYMSEILQENGNTAKNKRRN